MITEENLKGILGRQFRAGTRVTNCVLHASLNYDARPKDCELCFLDMQNHISYCHRVNEFVNAMLDDIRKQL